MTGQEAEDFFYAAYRRWLEGRDFDQPVIQANGRAYAWACVVAEIERQAIEAMRRELGMQTEPKTWPAAG